MSNAKDGHHKFIPCECPGCKAGKECVAHPDLMDHPYGSESPLEVEVNVLRAEAAHLRAALEKLQPFVEAVADALAPDTPTGKTKAEATILAALSSDAGREWLEVFRAVVKTGHDLGRAFDEFGAEPAAIGEHVQLHMDALARAQALTREGK